MSKRTLRMVMGIVIILSVLVGLFIWMAIVSSFITALKTFGLSAFTTFVIIYAVVLIDN